jgi:sterol desaturase/sphingolipid hydroxylase (fatty acid hydroxylase superfamily)
MFATSLVVGAAAGVLERTRPGTKLPRVSGWKPRAAAFVIVELLLVLGTVIAWFAVVDAPALFTLTDEPLWFQVSANWLLSTFVFYWWHRVRHDSDVLWRWTHQLHHSPQRIETITTFYKHPFEVIADTLLNLALSFMILGVSFEAFLLHASCVACSQFFVHMNVATPHWIGYFVQRPEMHRIHHESGVHRNNYADLPLWDILFGTFENPHDRLVACGFEPARGRRVLDMLLLRDVHHNNQKH